jgi:UDP-2,3-diacylglucosamine hydrolase
VSASAARSAAPPEAGVTVWFISDLHLARERQSIAEVFCQFLAREARLAQALYILGDLFDYWLGDDDIEDPFHRSIVTALAEVARAGCAVRVMHGNRDFLLGSEFAAAAGAQLIDDPTRIDLHGEPTLLLHGDTLCTADVGYQQFRARVRSPAWRRTFLSMPLGERRAAVESLRRENEGEKRAKSDAIMDAAESAVTLNFRNHRCTRMIHGHTHRPALHRYQLDGVDRERWVLADWYDSGEALRVNASGVSRLPLTQYNTATG